MRGSREGRAAQRIARRLVLVATGLAAPFVLLAWLELVVELLGVAPPRPEPIQVFTTQHDRAMGSEESLFRSSAATLWEPRPGAEAFGDVVNADARRGPRVPLAKGARFRVATLGDSSTFGLHVRDAECFARRIEAGLVARGIDADVVNDGCIGFTVVQGLRAWRAKTSRWSPDVVVIAFGAINEHFNAPNGLPDSQRFELFDSPTQRARMYMERFDAWRWLAESFGRQAPAAPAFRAVAKVPLDEFDATIATLEREVRAAGSHLLVVVPPRRRDQELLTPAVLGYTERLYQIGATRGTPLVDVYGEFRRRDEADPVVAADPSRSPLFVDRVHPSVAGHALYAELILAAIERQGWLPRPPEQE